MKNRIIFFTVLLVIWIAGCSWYYLCKVRSDCGQFTTAVTEPVPVPSAPVTIPVADSAEQSVVPPVYTVLFNSGAGQCELTNADNEYFSLVKQFVSANPESRIEITGYADNTGSETLNLKISTLRAEYVSQKLIDAGIPVARVAASGKGESEPVADNGTIEGRAKNRRVEIVTHKN